eukprot:2247755-Prymnesium_polylepis.1
MAQKTVLVRPLSSSLLCHDATSSGGGSQTLEVSSTEGNEADFIDDFRRELRLFSADPSSSRTRPSGSSP